MYEYELSFTEQTKMIHDFLILDFIGYRGVQHYTKVAKRLLEATNDSRFSSSFTAYQLLAGKLTPPSPLLSLSLSLSLSLQGQGGSECDFIPTMSPDSHVTFESMSAPGSHIGVLPSGQLTSPAQTDKLTDASHFRIKYLVSSY